MKPHSSVSLSIELYEDINVIFGDKGTEKTEMLKSLEQSMINKNMSVVTYYGNEKDSEFDKLINRDDYVIADTKLFNEEVKDAFEYIYSWNDVDPTSLKDYIEWYETKDNNENKKSLKICDLLNFYELIIIFSPGVPRNRDIFCLNFLFIRKYVKLLF